VPFSVGKSLPWIFDSFYEIPGKSADSPEARFDGKMMAWRYSIPGNHHTGNSRHPQRGIEPDVSRGEKRRRRTAPGLRRGLSSGKMAAPPAFRPSILLRSTACWGSEESAAVPRRGGYGSSWQRRA
jgi:hypothetical protein